MILDAADLNAGAVVEADLCIVGAGAAGITMARTLRGSGLQVLLLEAGGLEPSSASQALYAGEMVRRYGEDSAYLQTSRLRYFGGTTGHWRGWCRPLDAVDLEARDWMPNSGWPISRAKLTPLYRQACEVVHIPPFDGGGAGSTSHGRPILEVPGGEVETRIFHFSKPVRFGKVYRADIVDAPDVRLLAAAVTHLHTTEARGAVTEADAVTPEGKRLRVRARGFVLAAGGIENPRLLLSSDGLGNDRDQVGRYFMDHPHAGRYGQVQFVDRASAKKFAALYFDRKEDPAVGVRTNGVFVLSDRVKAEQRLQGWSVGLRRQKASKELDELGVAVGQLAGAVDTLGQDVDADPRIQLARMSIRAEQRPNPDSRVTLGDEVDALGLRTVRLDWRFTDEDAASMRRSAERFVTAVSAASLGRARLLIGPDQPWDDVKGGDHHIGTTRMASDPSTGVVDGHGRVHGVANLWVAGSSVFPTCGVSNPTLTIVALALRLAAHLRAELSR